MLKKKRRNWAPHRPQLLSRRNAQRLSHDCPHGYRIIWGDAGLRAQSCPLRLRAPKSPRAVTGQDRTLGVPATGPAPTLLAGGD